VHRAAATLADALEAEGRTADAVGAARLAEFFAERPGPAQEAAYARYLALWGAAFGDAVERLEVPYADGALPTLRYRTGREAHATVVAFGGFDSLIHEFHPIWRGLADAGFDVVAFDGPGQGGARTRHGLVHTHDWERPVAAVLDHLGLERVALLGMSMGGYWAVRAAAAEPRVAAVVSWSPVYDWLARFPRPFGAFVRWMARRRGFMNWSVRLRARAFPILGHVVRQALWLSGGREPVDAVDWMLEMNAAHVGSERVRAPALLMIGAKDRFQPPVLGRLQAAALTGAPVTVRVFTEAEHAAGHCQMGNLPLAIGEAAAWLHRTVPRA
jgi:pimeloyl-ACP methyl ester carboxylesterase